jgi:cytohesin
MSQQELYQAQAVLDFNLEPKKGIAYLRDRLGRRTDAEVGQWLAQMSTLTGGLDPTMLGSYFSRKDTLEVFKTFVRCLDFAGMDIVQAIRQLFDTFKPGGEGQVIARILELFAEAYFAQWVKFQDSTSPPTAYASSDSILQVAVSLIMLNTELHVASRRSTSTKLMTVEEYISNTRRVVGDEEVPESALRSWYDAVKQDQVSVEPLPRVAFSKLPVQPEIEGWLVAILDAQTHWRFWAVLALQRMYLFSDASEVEPADTIDLKDTVVSSVREDQPSKDRFVGDIRTRSCRSCFLPWGKLTELPDAELRAFEVLQRTDGEPAMLKHICACRPRTRFALVAESSDLADKWVQLISTGPY